MQFENLIRSIPDYPKAGIMFRDITTLLADPQGFKAAVDALAAYGAGHASDHVAGIEARGFILGGAVAVKMRKGFVPIRKKGKLPWQTIGQSYELEYGTDEVEVHVDAVKKGERVLLVDDLIATGGTARAAVQLIRRSGGLVDRACFVIDLPDLGGRKVLEEMGVEVECLCEFEGE
jgi:adenine phosphoribosyltransferase